MRTVGVEQELLLFERGTAHLARLGDALADPQDGPPGDTPGHPLSTVEHEFKRAQIEAATSPHERISDLRKDVEGGRHEIARRAAARESIVTALATDPAAGVAITTKDDRYAQMVALYGSVADSQLACGLHVHVSVTSNEEGVQILDRVGPWLPVLLAMSANSPYYQGRDTGYASFRSVMWGLWPTSGPTELFGDYASYRAVADQLISTGAAIDEAMVYFDARLSSRYPTVEIRVMDIPALSADVALLAALCRGLVQTAAEEAERGHPPTGLSRAVLRAMTWRAARHGITEQLVPADGSSPAPAGQVVAELVEHVRPALETSGDLALVQRGVAELFARGGGASMQRDAFRQRGSLVDVVTAAGEWTLAP
ncbi:MAG: glutamate--cysteine ligase [Actinomycetales bacterium]